MKRLATATVVLTALATLAQAGGLPKPIRLVERTKMYSFTHYVRGAEAGRGSSSSSAPAAEARQDQKAPKTATKAKPQPAKAD